ncbi:unnamed protein product [Paramecium primaurelia]|uniref:E2F-associated phosphoprotein n=1 Tax=Paramecium primaurelia TaxID=5886 RepID=A0A8S1PP48_PARPR|nr:unnamed protein product [Paramecium primaurelia]
MDIENYDDWDPDPHKQDSILHFSNINFSDNVIKRNKKKLENQVYDSQHVIDYAQQNWIDDDEDEEMKNNTQIEFDFEQTKKQLMMEQVFYNPLEDLLNEKYVQSKYETHLKNSENNTVISCSNCFIQISYHCQQHEIYKKQYRAMVTINTKIIENKFVKPLENEKVKNDDILLSVQCKMCQEEIGVYDVKAKIYHFFNVIQGLG